jgi:hypothetical protein
LDAVEVHQYAVARLLDPAANDALVEAAALAAGGRDRPLAAGMSHSCNTCCAAATHLLREEDVWSRGLRGPAASSSTGGTPSYSSWDSAELAWMMSFLSSG